MKLNDLKHNHSLTDLLKVLIFSILMLVPFLSVATRCLYVICNKNAKDSYHANLTNQIVYTETTDLKEYETYKLLLNQDSVYQTLPKVKVEFLNGSSNVAMINTWFTNQNQNIKYMLVTYSDITPLVEFFTEENTRIDGWLYGTGNYATREILVEFKPVNNYLYNINQLEIRTVQNYSTLDNVFEYSINQLSQVEYYNWTQNTALYTGIETMTTQLGITGATIPILLTYWFMLTIIYVVIDIILKIFTVLTHMLGNKTAK